VTLAGIGSAFWGLVLGVVTLMIARGTLVRAAGRHA
jgi:predicted benzoate:H+ symporter BenE